MWLYVFVNMFVGVATEESTVTAIPQCNSPFSCTDGGACTRWTDGCNECKCSEDGAACTEQFCECYTTNSCVPQCRDNDKCIRTIDDGHVIPMSSTTPIALNCNAPFICSDGSTCTHWTDGCNQCHCSEDGIVCTERFCDCYKTNSCVPLCQDNGECTFARPTSTAISLPPTTNPTCNSPFTCLDGGTCTMWTDGCNGCMCIEDGVACSDMYCDCYNTDSCVPKCQDNDNCVYTIITPGPLPTASMNKCRSPFTCWDGDICLQWTDGCNQCGCMDDGFVCTDAYCDCYRTNTCVPQCNVNDRCTPTAMGDPMLAMSRTTTLAGKCESPFMCPGGGTCMQWTDGCNACRCTEFGAVCTEMYCDCYNTDTCVPQCSSNDNCIPDPNMGPDHNVVFTSSVPPAWTHVALSVCTAWSMFWVAV